MRLLLDESVPATLRRDMPGHDVRTTVEMGWSGVKNGELLGLAAKSFEAFVTIDKNMPFQQNLAALPIALIVLDAISNEAHVLRALLPALERELVSLRPRTYVLMRPDA